MHVAFVCLHLSTNLWRTCLCTFLFPRSYYSALHLRGEIIRVLKWYVACNHSNYTLIFSVNCLKRLFVMEMVALAFVSHVKVTAFCANVIARLILLTLLTLGIW